MIIINRKSQRLVIDLYSSHHVMCLGPGCNNENLAKPELIKTGALWEA